MFLQKHFGKVTPATELEDILQNLTFILKSRRGSGYFLEDFGLSDVGYRTPAEMITTLTAEISENIRRYEPRVELLRVDEEYDRDGKRSRLVVSLRLKDAKDRVHIVFDLKKSTMDVVAAEAKLAMGFIDSLSGTLVLALGATTVTIQAGDWKRFELKMEPWGIEGTAEFWIVCESDPADDELFAAFLGTDPISVTLALGRSWSDPDQTSSGITVKGLVIDKSVMERSLPDLVGAPVLQRKYEIRFQDRGQALWRQHRPANLYVGKTLKDLVDDNLPSGVTITHTWTASSAAHPVLALALGVNGGEATYYDFLTWLLSKNNAGLYYAAGSDAYSILDTKPSDSSPIALHREHVATVEEVFPATRRDIVRVLNAWSEAATSTKAGANSDGVSGLRTDYLIRSSIAADLTTRSTLETSRAAARKPTLELSFAVFPTDPVLPSRQLTFGEGFSTALFPNGTTYRAQSVHIVGIAENQVAGSNAEEPSNRYALTYDVVLEDATDPVFHYPSFVAPIYPFHVEGKVLSETGATTDGTYQSYTDQASSLDQYQVKVPLWNDQKVVVLYEPLAQSGHFYFPLYRDARVLLALHFDSAKIAAFLDWRPGAQLPLDSQGNHILMGKAAKNQTSIQHVYEQGKPALKIARTSQTDVQTMTMSDGTIRMETKDTEE